MAMIGKLSSFWCLKMQPADPYFVNDINLIDIDEPAEV